MRDLSHLLVTGGAGFIGSTLVKKLLLRGEVEKITVLDQMIHPESKSNLLLAAQDSRLEIIEGNINDPVTMKNLVEGQKLSGVFHLAAETRESHLQKSLAADLSGTMELISTLGKAGIPMVLCSSASVYGSAPFPTKFSESTPLSPISLAASTEAARDHLAGGMQHESRQDLILTRATHCYGPGQDRTKLIPRLVYQALREEPVIIQGSGRMIRDWMHVDDCALGLITCYLSARSGGVYHLGCNSEHTDLGIARSILKLLRKPEGLIQHEGERSLADDREALDTRRALQILKWKARIPFRSGFEGTVRELAAHLRPAAEV